MKSKPLSDAKKPTWKKFIFVYFAIILIAGLILFGIMMIRNYGVEIRNEETNIGMVSLADNGATRYSEITPPYYNDMQTAIQKAYEIESPLYHRTPPNLSDELIRFEQDNYIFVVFVGDPSANLISMMFYKDGEKISYPIYIWFQGIDSISYDHSYKFYEADRVARDIVYSNTQKNRLKVNGGKNLYFGAGMGEEIKKLTILGDSPTEVIPFNYKGHTYYFWYYKDDRPFTQVFEKNINIESFTLAEVIKALDIRLGEQS